MSRIETVRAAMMQAMKDHDKERKEALSLLLSALKNKAIDKRADLTEDEENAVVLREIKQCQESIEQANGREDIIAENTLRMKVYQEFAPKMMSEDEVEAEVTAVLAEKGVKPAYLAGLSLGEYSALQAAGVFTAKQAIELTAFRGKAMAEAAKGLACGMTAVLGLDREKLSACCEQAAETGCVQICNYNCPGQLVIGGEKAAVDKAAALAKEAGARRCIPLKVSGPFHTRLMAPAGDALAKRFASEPFGEMQVPVLFNCLGREKAEQDSIPALLVKQVQSSVYMEDTLHRLGELGVDHILEVGPGSALAGFVKKTLPGVVCASVETPEQLSAALTAWKEEL